MLALIPLAFAFQSSVTVTVGGDSAQRARARQAAAEVAAELEAGGSGRNRRPVRRIPVTDELRASAFRDAAARDLLLRARLARLGQDAALESYDATTYQRLSVGLGFKAFGRERLAMRHEEASHVQWQRGRGAVLEVKGSRTVVPIARGSGDAERDARAEVSGFSPIPYFPGREELLIGAGVARPEVDDRNFVHPIAEGAEAYYTYATGDSVMINLPDGRRITLRELRIQARWPKWNLTVGSFWFDEESAHLVRAVYRISTPLDVWAAESEEREAERNDTSAVAARRSGLRGCPPNCGGRRSEGPPLIVKAMFSPMRVDVSAISIEYGLFNQRFWLPRAQALEGHAQVGFMRMPVRLEHRFKYASVNALTEPLAVPAVASPLRALRDSLDSAKTEQPVRDSLLRAARTARARELAAQRERECAETGSHTNVQRRYSGAVVVATSVPCDSAKLWNSPDLPPSIYDPGEELFGAADRDALRKALSFGLQPGWSPQKPTVEWGLAFTRYNRVEGFSSGFALKSVLGRGYTAELGARGSVADKQANGDLTLSRSNGRSTLRGAVYRRLDVMTDWGTPLSFGASAAALLYARDEGAYFRTWGAEIAGTQPRWGTLDWRLFAEQQWKADLRSRWTLFGGGNDSRFIENPAAQPATQYGAALRLHSSAGLDPDGFRLLTDLRAEGAGGGYAYSRGLFDATLSHALGKRLAASLTASAGYSGGTLPVQRKFYLGGLQSVRGQTALTASGDAFWLGHAELGVGGVMQRLVAFGDVGWAGDRRDWSKPGRPLAGVGVGSSFLDGLVRFDVARGLYPARQWRADLYLEAKF